MSNNQTLIELTNHVKDYLERTDAIYEKARETKEESDFFSVIKPFVEEVHEVLDKWADVANKWVETNKPRNIYEEQINSVNENFKEIVVQAYFPKTSYSRFKHNVHSINYILEKLITEINKTVHN